MGAETLRLHNPNADVEGEWNVFKDPVEDHLLAAEQFMMVQAGHVSHELENGHDCWRDAYREALRKEHAELLIHIKDRGPLLDIGGGMGAIDALLYQRGAASTVTIIDGMADDPTVVSHDEPFSNAAVARRFLEANGVASEDLFFVDARARNLMQSKLKGRNFQTVISLRSWCFHYAPEVYAPIVYEHMAPGGVIIVDVRKGKEWAAPPHRWFGEPVAVIRDEPKYQRLVFHV